MNELRFRTQIYGANASAENLFLYEKWTHSLRYGVEFSRSDVSSDFIRTDFLPVVTRENRIGMAPSKVDRASLFVFNEIAFGQREQWSLFPGIR
ncbi:hypothetical protein RZS08_58255, partial [Arthrospira platensis SPKY1]|nr:hypothetical protein [Arthrospira platensis SPKY1]